MHHKNSVFPPLPDAFHSDMNTSLIENEPVTSLANGCYSINYVLNNSAKSVFDGTLRIETHDTNARAASGDLYKQSVVPNTTEIPIFPIKNYAYYIRVIKMVETPLSIELSFELFSFKFTGGGKFTNEGILSTVLMPRKTASNAPYFEGVVKNTANKVVGTLKMTWISPFLRQATIEIDTAPNCEAPLSNGALIDWKTIYEDANWHLNAYLSNNNITEPSGNSWSNREMHAAMLAKRDISNLDIEWRYHILAVRNLDQSERGIMYDDAAVDSDKIPREGIGIAAYWQIPNTPEWGLVAGKRTGMAMNVFFRTAVHEIGHSMGLMHNMTDAGFMNATNTIAAMARPDMPFPTNVKWAFSDDDKRRLRHYPDIYIRPGGVGFGKASMTSPTVAFLNKQRESAHILLEIKALMPIFPLGAPVRLDLKLTNMSGMEQFLPSNIGLKSGFLRGIVVDENGKTRPFSSVIICADNVAMQGLKNNQNLSDSLTLLRGSQGILFPKAGCYTVHIEINYDVNETSGFFTKTTVPESFKGSISTWRIQPFSCGRMRFLTMIAGSHPSLRIFLQTPES